MKKRMKLGAFSHIENQKQKPKKKKKKNLSLLLLKSIWEDYF